MNYDRELVDEFIVEAREHLAIVEDLFLTLEKTCDDPDPALVDRVFRSIHTIKGAAGFLGLRNINDIAHAMETLLSLFRSMELRPTSTHVDALLAGADLLGQMVNDIEASHTLDVSEAKARLEALLPGHGDTTPSPHAPPLRDRQGGLTGFRVDPHTATRLQKSPTSLYVLRYNLDELFLKKGKTPLALIRELLKVGEIVDGLLESSVDTLEDASSETPLFYDILYSSVIDPDDVPAFLGVPKERVRPLDKRSLLQQLPPETAVSAQAPPEPIQERGETAPPDLSPAPRTESAHSSPSASGQESPKASGDAPETVRISVEMLDRLMNLAGELVLVRNQQLLRTDRSDPTARSIVQRLDVVTSELQEAIMLTRMQPMGNLFNRFPRIVRDLGKKLGKEIGLHLSGTEVELDRTILESLSDPLTHLIRNSCDHGIETREERHRKGKPEAGRIRLSAFHEGGQINVEIQDDGRGIDAEQIREKALLKGFRTQAELERLTPREVLQLILLPGFSTAEKVTDISGRGVGMDVVKTNIERLGGALSIESEHGQGTTIRLRLPLTLAIIPCLIVRVGEERFAIPQVNLEELICLYDSDVLRRVEYAGEQEVYRLRNQLLPLVRLEELLAHPEPYTSESRASLAEANRHIQAEELARFEEAIRSGEDPPAHSLNFAVVTAGPHRFGLIIDKVLGTEEIVVKPLHPALSEVRIYSGATVMGDGRVALILDIEGIAQHAGLDPAALLEKQAEKENEAALPLRNLLLFRHGPQELFAVEVTSIRRIEKIGMNRVERVGTRDFIAVEDHATRIIRLDQFMDVSPGPDLEERYLLLPKSREHPFGILASELVDIREVACELDTSGFHTDGLRGTSLIDGRMTLFLDLNRLISLAEPEWAGSSSPTNR